MWWQHISVYMINGVIQGADHTFADSMVSHKQQQAIGYPSREVIVLAKSWKEVKDVIQGRGLFSVAMEPIGAKKAFLGLFPFIS